MNIFWKIFIGFWFFWIIWYITGGPLRDNRTKPYIGPSQNGGLQLYSTSTVPR